MMKLESNQGMLSGDPVLYKTLFRFLGKAKFEETFEHNVEHSLRESQTRRRSALKETLSNIESEKLKVPSVLGAGAEVDANVRRYANIGLGAVAFIIRKWA